MIECEVDGLIFGFVYITVVDVVGVEFTATQTTRSVRAILGYMLGGATVGAEANIVIGGVDRWWRCVPVGDISHTT